MGLRDIAAVLAGQRQEQRSDSTASLLAGFLGAGGAGSVPQSIGYESAQTHGAVYGCVDLLVRLVGWQMPAYIGDTPARPTVVANPHPDPQMSGEHWRSQALESVMLRGYAAGLVTSFEPSGWPRKILPLHPDLVTWWDDNGRWRWYADGKPVELWQEGGSLWVAPSMRVAPGQPVGRSVIGHAAAKIRLGMSATKFGRDYFDAQGQPVSHLKVTDQPNVGQAVAAEIKSRYQQAVRSREPLVTGNAWELNMISVNAEESQFLETISANVADVCMFFGVPPEAIGGSSGDSMTYANVEGRNLALLTNTVGAWMAWLEAVYSMLLPRPQRVSLDPEALLRTSVPTLFNTANVGFASGLLERDEGRAMIGYGPARPDGDFKQPATPGVTTGGSNGEPTPNP